jgi:hypothetical protein
MLIPYSINVETAAGIFPMFIAFAVATGIEYNACSPLLFITRLQLIRVKTVSKRIRKVVHQISCLMLMLVKSGAGAVLAVPAKHRWTRLCKRARTMILKRGRAAAPTTPMKA